MNNQLLPLLTPHLTVGKAMEIAELMLPQFANCDPLGETYKYAFNLLQSYETFKQKKLSREIVEELFDGFEKWNDTAYIRKVRSSTDLIKVNFKLRALVIDSKFKLRNPTIGDLFTEIERYNRTATSKINLQFTENILKELGL